MKIVVQRRWETTRSITGEMWIDGQFDCFTLEAARTNPLNAGHPCIPLGTYPVIFSFSPRLKYVTPELQNVPGRSEIRVHVANFPRELLGCIAVGEVHNTDYVGTSQRAFDRLMVLLKTATDPITLTVLDIPPPSMLPIP